MKKYFILFTILLSIFCSNTVNAQICGSDQVMKSLKSYNPDLQQRIDIMNERILLAGNSKNKSISNPITIPVLIYVINNGEMIGTGTNISDAQCQNQLTTLNNNFYNFGIKFCLATRAGTSSSSIPIPTGATQLTPGIIHVSNAAASVTTNDPNGYQSLIDVTTNTSTTPLSSDNFLKIYVVKSINGNSILGYGTFPYSFFDGVVMRYDVFGDVNTCTGCNLLPPNNQGKVLVHEVGHYLGLYHTFEGACSGSSLSNCASSGDRVCDTPQSSSYNIGCPTTNVNTCQDTPVDLPDAINNHMNYTNDSCRNQFTSGQIQRMLNTLNLDRSELFNTENLIYTGVCGYQTLISANFTPSTYQSCTNTSINFVPFQASVANSTYSWNFGDGTPLSNSSTSVFHTFTNATNSPFKVTLTITKGTEVFTYNTLIYVKICTPILNSESNWQFSYANGLKFGTGVPIEDSSIPFSNSIQRNCAVISDSSGNMLFYTNGQNVYRSNHTQINSVPLMGAPSGAHGSIIVPIPNSTNYYIFTKGRFYNTPNGELDGFRRSTVLVNGSTISMPTVTMNVPIISTTGMPTFLLGTDGTLIGTPALNVMPKCDGSYWIFTVFKTTNTDYSIAVYSLSSTTLNYVSSINLPYQESSSSFSFQIDQIVLSPDGNKLVYLNNTRSNNLYMFDFDKLSGLISNQKNILIAEQIQNPSSWNFFLGGSFSPDSNLFYVTDSYRTFYQLNIKSTDPNLTKRIITKTKPAGNSKLGPDGKIYSIIAKTTNNFRMCVINNPNSLNTDLIPNNCGFTSNGPLLSRQLSGSLFWHLPNTITSLPANSISINATTCQTYKFFPNVSQLSCSQSFIWNFGDPSSGTNNTSTLNNPTHFFATSGAYTVSLYTNTNVLITSQTFQVEQTIAPIILGSNTACITTNQLTNNTVNLTADQTIVWSTNGAGNINGQNNASSVEATWTTLPGQLTATVSNSNGCSISTTKTITSFCECDCLNSLYVAFVPQLEDAFLFRIRGNPCTNLNLRYVWSRPSLPIVVNTTGNLFTLTDSYVSVLVELLSTSGSVLCSVTLTYFGYIPPTDSKFTSNGIKDKSKFTKNDSQNELTISPNPTNGVFVLKTNNIVGKVTIMITDTFGRLVYEMKDQPLENEKTIDLSSFQSGVYLVKVTSEEANFTQKIIKN